MVKPGYPIGWKDPKSEDYYIYNHLTFIVLVHKTLGDFSKNEKQMEMAVIGL